MNTTFIAVIRELSSLVNMTFYGFLVILMAAYMFMHGHDQAGYLMLTAGSTMVGVAKSVSQPAAPATSTVNVDKVQNAVLNETGPK